MITLRWWWVPVCCLLLGARCPLSRPTPPPPTPEICVEPLSDYFVCLFYEGEADCRELVDEVQAIYVYKHRFWPEVE